jgi:ABC-type glycerol-3-phosphate transport system substrate-binding protein
MKINITTLLGSLKQKTIGLFVFGLSVVILVFIADRSPSSLNTYFPSHTVMDTYDYPSLSTVFGFDTYATKQRQYREQGYPTSDYEHVFHSDDLRGQIVTESNASYAEAIQEYALLHEGNRDVFLVDQTHEVSFTFDFGFATLNYFSIDYYVLDEGVEDTKVSVLINGQTQFYEAQALILPAQWAFVTDTFALDRYENELQPNSEKVMQWSTSPLSDPRRLHVGPFAFFVEPGDEVTLQFVNAPFLVGAIESIRYEPLPTYDTYRSRQPNAPLMNELKMISARSIVTRSDSSIRLRTEQDASAMAYDTQFLRLNTIFGDSWEKGGQSITYAIENETAGFYQLSFKYRQYLLNDMLAHRRILINGEVPFDAMEAFPFPYTMQFRNRTLKNEQGEAYWFYLPEGTNTITLEAVNYPYRQAIETIQYVMNNIQTLALSIKRYTAGSNDLYRDWDIETFFPSAKTDILSWADELQTMYDNLLTLSMNQRPSQIANVVVSISRLKTIANQINRLPSRMVQFSDGDSSVNQMLGVILQEFFRSSLEIERTMVHGNRTLPRPSANFLRASYEGAARLVLSFVNNPYSATQMNEEELNVWVNHPRQYIEIMQALIDQQYPGTRRVTLSQMPDENKLILSNISGQSPDIALGVNHWIPYDFAARDAALDLRQFAGYEETVRDFAKGAMIPYVFEDGVYGLPGTQNFWVTFYRRDVLSSIGMNEIPQTWDEVVGSLPLLQSYGLNYFIPLSQYSGLKPFVATLPFIHQFGGSLYAEDGMSTTINSEETLEGLTLMSELYTLYNVPKFVASFYNNFRYGTIPIGIGDLGTYLLLTSAASELDGLWGMDLHPGVLDPQTGEINRSAASGAQGSMILGNTNLPDDSWEFLKWWMSEDIQASFGQILQSTYGKAYFWNSANLRAFERSSMPQEFKDVVLEQWEYALEASRIPGTYMVEREISNAWTNIVFNGMNPRQALDEAVRISNREILYKMEEFGYTFRGEILKPYLVPTIDNIDRWLTEHA